MTNTQPPTPPDNSLWHKMIAVAGDKLPPPLLVVILAGVLIIGLLTIQGITEMSEQTFYILLAVILLIVVGLLFWLVFEWMQFRYKSPEDGNSEGKSANNTGAKQVVEVNGDGAAAVGDHPRVTGSHSVQVHGNVGGNVSIHLPEPTSAPVANAVASSTDKWPHSYLYGLQRQCGRVTLAAIDPRAHAQGHVEFELQEIFTDLDVRKMQRPDEEQMRKREGIPHEEPLKEQRQPVLELVSDHKKLVIKGAPGAGKSTFMRYLALCLAGEQLQDERVNLSLLSKQGWRLPTLYPIYVILRDFAARGLPHQQSLWQFITAEMETANLPNCITPLQRQLEEKGGILLLDGLDEVPEPNQRREALRREVEQFIRDFPKVRVVVTTRPYAYQNQAWRLSDFAETDLLDFSMEQIGQYIERWYNAAAYKDPNLPADRAAQYQKQLQDEVKRNEHLRRLAQRPLLLALMVSLHRSREGGALPQRRIELYDASVNLLLDIWQRPKIIYGNDGRQQGQELNALTELGIDMEALRKALSELAYQVHKSQPNLVGTADIPRRQLVETLDQIIPKEKRGQINHDRIANYIKDRAGLLEDRGEDVYGFPHRTFQEYLAAMYLGGQSDFPTNVISLVRRDPERWREATLLAGNDIKHIKHRWDMVRDLYEGKLPIPDAPPSQEEVWGGFLAGQLIWDSELLQAQQGFASIIEEVAHWQALIVSQGHLSPLDRAMAGRLLGQLGDPRRGVGVRDGLPDIWWGEEVPAGTYHFGREIVIAYPYKLARYPVTQAQFALFEGAADVHDGRWWEGMPADAKQFNKPAFAYANHPRENVSWYQAVAFCRWLNDKLGVGEGEGVRLPHEDEWEVAARYPHGQSYPWGDEWDSNKANTQESGINMTTAVGSYPQGVNKALGLYDMSGNVWEWCQNKYDYPKVTAVDQRDDWRVLRGGSWDYFQGGARAVCRDSNHPYARHLNLIGFRLVCPPSLV